MDSSDFTSDSGGGGNDMSSGFNDTSNYDNYESHQTSHHHENNIGFGTYHSDHQSSVDLGNNDKTTHHESHPENNHSSGNLLIIKDDKLDNDQSDFPLHTSNGIGPDYEGNNGNKYTLLENCDSTETFNANGNGNDGGRERINEDITTFDRVDFFRAINNVGDSEDEKYGACCSNFISYVFCCFL